MTSNVSLRQRDINPFEEREVGIINRVYPEPQGCFREAFSDVKDIFLITKDFTIECAPSIAKTSGRLIVITSKVAKDAFLFFSGLVIGLFSERRYICVIVSEGKKSLSRISVNNVCYCVSLAVKASFKMLCSIKYSLDVIKIAKALSNSSLELVIPRNNIDVEGRPRSSWQAMKETLYLEADKENSLLGDTKIKRIITLSGILSGIAIAPICWAAGLYASVPFASAMYFGFFAITGGLIEILFTKAASLIGILGNPIANLGRSINYMLYYSSFYSTTVSGLVACVIFGAYMGGMFARRWADTHGNDFLMNNDIAFRKGAIIGGGGTVVASLVSTVAYRIIKPTLSVIFYPMIKAYRIYKQITIINGIKLVCNISYSSLKLLFGYSCTGIYKIFAYLGMIAKNKSVNLIAEASSLSSRVIVNL